MSDIGFYSLKDGSIGKIHYIINVNFTPPEGKREEILNIGMAKHVEKMLWDRLLNKNAAVDPNKIYSHARENVGKDFDAYYTGPRRYGTTIQIGNKSSYEEILKIESNPNFINWEDVTFVNEIKEIYLKNKK